jgi:hypothetical protein
VVVSVVDLMPGSSAAGFGGYDAGFSGGFDDAGFGGFDADAGFGGFDASLDPPGGYVPPPHPLDVTGAPR